MTLASEEFISSPLKREIVIETDVHGAARKPSLTYEFVGHEQKDVIRHEHIRRLKAALKSRVKCGVNRERRKNIPIAHHGRVF
jgi:hypothetical protein